MARTCKWGVLTVVGGEVWDHSGDALITPANNRLSGREGLDSMIHAKAGQELTQVTRNICLEKRKINAPPCAVTHNVVTEPFALALITSISFTQWVQIADDLVRMSLDGNFCRRHITICLIGSKK